MKTIEDALRQWEKEGLLTKEKVHELKKSLAREDDHHSLHIPRAVTIFATLGAVLIGLGVLLFVGSNWRDMGPMMRIAVLFLGYGIVAAGAYVTEQRKFEKTAEALWFLTTIMLGANIFLLAQIFHYSLTYWQGPFLWLIGALAMGYVRQSKAHGVLAVILGVFTIGWIGTGGGRGFDGQMGAFFVEDGLLPILPLFGIGLCSLGIFLRKFPRWNFLVDPCLSWGMLGFAVPFVLTTVDKSVADAIFAMAYTQKQVIIAVLCVCLLAGALSMGLIKESIEKVYLLALGILAALPMLQSQGHSHIGMVLESQPFVFILYILLLFALSLWSVWVGMKVSNARLVNLGLLATVILIVIQYFSWTFSMLNRSLAFILGGILLIALTIGIERKRRDILSKMHA